ncbi:unnamed protein product [Prorocentrum cordatum]|uniref:Uncharacterized protein n=1 Tax=Prorocentrum cordatum TaxID=2364126 RepID=A0ABN9U1E3_9DINO|nr:unnamed protein product [Polarella glacialis]
MARNRNFNDVKISARPRWATEADLGATLKSKTWPIATYDGHADAGPPTQAFLAGRVRMPHEMRKGDWHLQRGARRSFFNAQCRAQKTDAAPAPLTAATRALFVEWYPDCLPGAAP